MIHSSQETTTPSAVHGPLTGVRVIDLATVFAAPFAATLLADFGADVIKVELPKIGDAVRGMTPVVKGVPGPWTVLSRNKRCISLDVRKEKGKELLKKLVAQADLVIENFRPGTLEKWGLGYDVLKGINPRLIMVRISGYGQSGPYAHKAGFGTPATAFGGLTYMQGYPDRPPVSPPFPLVDYLTGVFGAFGAVMALYHLKSNDQAEGQQVDLALYESIFRILEPAIVQYDLTGVSRGRAGHALQESAPAGAFQCKDGKWVILVTSTQRTFSRLAEVMGRTDLLSNPHYDTNPHRVEHREAILAIVQEWTAQYPSDELMKLGDESGIPISPIPSMAEIFQNPQYKAREDLIQVEHPILGTMNMPGIVPKMLGTPGAIRFPGPSAIGADNREVYQEMLGLSDAEMEALEAEEVI